MIRGDGPMEFMQIIIDFVTLGAIGLFSTITLAVWYEFCNIFVFDQGYLRWLQRHSILKAIIVITLGVAIWGNALCQIHQFLWGAHITEIQQKEVP